MKKTARHRVYTGGRLGAREIMNFYEITLHDTESTYLLARTKYRALELVGDYLDVINAGMSQRVAQKKTPLQR